MYIKMFAVSLVWLFFIIREIGADPYQIESIRHMVHRNLNNLGTMQTDVRRMKDNQLKFSRQFDEMQTMLRGIEGQVRERGLSSEDLGKLIAKKIDQHQGPFPPAKYPRDCADVKKNGGDKNGIYTVYVPEEMSENPPLVPVSAYCDMSASGGGWLVMLNHIDDKLKFYEQKWIDYERGFGNLVASHWLGNKFVSMITGMKTYTLRVELMDYLGQMRWAEYKYFKVGSAREYYRLIVDGYSGNAGDGLAWQHNGMRFSSAEKDHDMSKDNCASGKGGWWFRDCFDSVLTGVYYHGRTRSGPGTGIIWSPWGGRRYSLKKAKMMIRPADYEQY